MSRRCSLGLSHNLPWISVGNMRSHKNTYVDQRLGHSQHWAGFCHCCWSSQGLPYELCTEQIGQVRGWFYLPGLTIYRKSFLTLKFISKSFARQWKLFTSLLITLIKPLSSIMLNLHTLSLMLSRPWTLNGQQEVRAMCIKILMVVIFILFRSQ